MTHSDGQSSAVAIASDRAATIAALVIFVFIALKLVLFLVLTHNSAFVMDEYLHFNQVRVPFDRIYQDLWPAKTMLFALYLGVATWFAEGAVELMTVARFLSAGVAIAGLGLLYGIARNIGRSRLEGLFVVCLVLTFSSYLEWAFMVRPEPLALLFGLASLLAVTRDGGNLRACFLAGLLSGFAFITMQKAVYFNFALGVALVGDGLMRRSLREAVALGATLVVGWTIVILAYVGIFALQGADFLAALRHIFLGPTLENAVSGHAVYVNIKSYLWQTFSRNFALYMLCAVGLLLALPGLSQLSKSERRAWIFTLVLAVLIFSMPAPWPYNFILIIPFLGLWSTVPLRRYMATPGPDRTKFAGVLVFVFALSFIRLDNALLHDNEYQNETVRRVESLLSPNDTYADGIGMVVTRRPAVSGWWDWTRIGEIRAQATQGNLATVESIFDHDPKIWILSYRSLALQDILSPFLENAYVPIYPNVLIAGSALSGGGETSFQVRWPGRYRLFDAFGRPSDAPFEVDGEPATGEIGLDNGPHRVRVAADVRSLYFLPADVNGKSFDMNGDLAQRLLFSDTYTF